MEEGGSNPREVGQDRPQVPDTVPVVPGVEDLEPIGRGGFGVVYRGRQPDLAREVAVKVVMSPAAQDSAVERWRKEIAAMGRLSNHPNIVTVYSGGLTEGGLPYLVMPYVPGGSLHDRMSREGPLPPGEVAAIGSKLAGALAAAHAVGVLHRDVKPDNVLLSPYGEPQLTDFGIARLLDTTTTAAGTVHATIRYAAPEVLSGQPATEASDVYGLGATLYACLTGAAPYADSSDESIVALVGRIASEDPADLRTLDVPGELACVIHAALSKSPADRIASANALQQRLAEAGESVTTPAAADRTVVSRTVAPPADDHQRTAAVPVAEIAPRGAPDPEPYAAATTPAARPELQPGSASERRIPQRGWGLLAALGILVAGLAALLMVMTGEADPSDGASTTAPSSASADGTSAAGDPDPASPTTVSDRNVAEALASRAAAYFDAIREGRLGASYGMLSPSFRRQQPRSDYEAFWRGREVEIEGAVSVDEEALAVTVPLSVDGKREDFRLTFTRGEDGTWYVDGPRPG